MSLNWGFIREDLDFGEWLKKGIEEEQEWQLTIDNTDPHFEEKDGIIFHHDQIYIPNSVHPETLWLNHNIPAAGHSGVKHTEELVWLYYLWPNVHEYVKEYV